jgi:hypothetical protein
MPDNTDADQIDYTKGLDTMDSLLEERAARNAREATAAANALRADSAAYDPATCRPSDKTILQGERDRAGWTAFGAVVGAAIGDVPGAFIGAVIAYNLSPNSTLDGENACLRAKKTRQ